MLVDALLDANRRSPHRVAVDDGVHALTYRRLTRIAGVLRDVVQPQMFGERIGLMLPASSMFPAALFGTLWASKVAVPLNFLLHANELSSVVRDAGVDAIVSTRHFSDLSARLPAKTIFLKATTDTSNGLLSLRRNPPNPPL